MKMSSLFFEISFILFNVKNWFALVEPFSFSAPWWCGRKETQSLFQGFQGYVAILGVASYPMIIQQLAMQKQRMVSWI